MPKVELRIDGAAVDDWLADLSTEFPDDEFRLLATQSREEHPLALLEARTKEGDRFVRRFEAAPEVLSSDVVYHDDRLVLVQFTTVVTELYDALRGSDNVSLYPTVLRNGRFSVTLTASHERLSNYADELRKAGIPYQVSSLAQSYDSGELLTERQREFVTAAVQRGYYDTPRGCTLTELAEEFEVHKSAASRLLHRAEGRIMREFVESATKK
ncbi:DNA-binding protein [Haladaptatus sp. R4]|uniref:helix-turn-helix domain-containing protein n=1 Tax=Haladaptatus sp. R4 TaxID=1679489 RepID=UPI0007B49749|nr:helix-turn-helix domain-containing protein [Haladaptatus sp. R4]KZN24545.1 DNA-binding protein [Haladaptatus sp. R4]